MNHQVNSLDLLSISFLFLGAITITILLLQIGNTNYFLYAQGVGNSSYSIKPKCIGGTPVDTNIPSANASPQFFSKDVNSANGTTELVQEKNVNSTMNDKIANMSTGSGEFIGSSKAIKPQFNLIPQNKEPVRLIPNLTAFEEAKNQVNSACPPNELIGKLGNKNIVEPTIIPHKN